jgi:trehalose/maltose hydrolase-like predicted phosphorylase
MKRWVAVVVIVFFLIGAATFHYWKPGPRVVKHPPNNDPWKLVSYDPDNPYGTYLGNGFIATRVMGDGVGTKCYMAGLYDNEKLIPTPNWADLRFYDGKKQFRIDKQAPYKQVLDMKTGILTTYATWRAGEKTLTGKIEMIVSRAEPSTALVRATLTPGFSGTMRFGDIMQKPARGAPLQFCASKVFLLQSFEGPGGASLRVACRQGRTLAASVWTSVAGEEKGLIDRHCAAIEGARAFVTAHKAAWAKLWQKDIIIDGPVKDQQAIHSCMFYLLESVREGSQWSIPPMGLSNDAFSGHVFWDADVWMFPALLLQHPDLARSIVDYRYNTLPGAMANAKASGYAGAEYAWESGYTGKEDTPPGLSYRYERHINGDVALAQWQYYLATGNNEWLKTRGFPVLKATADYWASRVTYNKAKDRYEILKVVPPDENAEIVNNSVYTNAIAQMNLEFAMRAAKIVGAQANPKWSEVAAKMYIPYDAKTKRFVPFDGYKGFQAKQADTELMIYPLQYKFPGQDMTSIYANTFRFYQPKVLPNGPAMSASAHAVIAARLGDCAGAYKFWQESWMPFVRGPFNYFNEKRSRTWDNMCFLTGAAGPIQSALFGIAGARIDYDNPQAKLDFKPCLPKNWKKLTITGLQWRGSILSTSLIVLPGNKVKGGAFAYNAEGHVDKVEPVPGTRGSTQNSKLKTQN